MSLPALEHRPEARAEGVVAGPRVRVGDMPVWVGAAGDTSPKSVRVELLDLRTAERAGLTGVMMRVSRADGEGAAAPVSLSVDYSGFATAVGGDWAARLRLVRLPACAASSPQLKRCQTTTPVGSRNHWSEQRVSAELEAGGGGGAMYALAASASGGTGSYAATPLGPSSTWQVSNQTGDFSWSYPLRVPPAVNGPAPELTIGYSSGSVDGRTASTNNQPSWVGEGHSLESGYVERKYVSCSDDMSGGNNTTTTGDLCWKTDNATLVLGGRSGELVKKSDGTWRLENDDGSKIERLSGAANGDNGGEHWRLTTTDGTQYYFGLHKRYAADTAATNSTWTVPVFGNHSGEPCHASSYAASSCVQAWRWNVDYVVDPHGNTMTYSYAKESNNYGRNNNSAVSSYTRGGYLTSIEYGERKGSEHTTNAPARVSFTVAERCIPSGTITCAESQLTAANARYWPDVPYDQICTSSSSCPSQISPAFFTRKRLTAVTTSVWSGGTYVPVDSWALTQAFPATGDETPSGLWLSSLRHTGKVGGDLALPYVQFTGVQLDNRVDYRYDTGPRMIKWRVAGGGDQQRIGWPDLGQLLVAGVRRG
ncbi:MAG: SpvB/TcaC N-terminal domain-containing protein [Micromonosporaceae bacterium]